MSTDSNREEMIARFVEHWSRAAQGGAHGVGVRGDQNSWKSWRRPAPPRRKVADNARQEQSPSVHVRHEAQPARPGVEQSDRSRLDAAARRALVAFPGSVGELIEREISVYLSFGFRLAGGDLISRLADQVLAGKLPDGPSSTPITSPTSPRSVIKE
jgi:hypothetical protein